MTGRTLRLSFVALAAALLAGAGCVPYAPSPPNTTTATEPTAPAAAPSNAPAAAAPAVNAPTTPQAAGSGSIPTKTGSDITGKVGPEPGF